MIITGGLVSRTIIEVGPSESFSLSRSADVAFFPKEEGKLQTAQVNINRAFIFSASFRFPPSAADFIFLLACLFVARNEFGFLTKLLLCHRRGGES